jgi:hypothetical protein
MNIKTGDYIEDLRGIVGVVNTVGRPAENENGKRFAFDWDILYPEKMTGNRGFFEGDESALWKQFKRVGTYKNPFLKERIGKKPIEPFELMEKEKINGYEVTCNTDGTKTIKRGMMGILVQDIPDNATIALKINEIINYLNAEEM